MTSKPFPPVPDYLERDPASLFSDEFRHSEKMSRFVTRACGLLMHSCMIRPEDLEMLREVDGPVVLAGTHEGISDIPVLSAVAIQGGLEPIRMVSKVENFYSPDVHDVSLDMDELSLESLKSFVKDYSKKELMQIAGYCNRRLGAYPIDKNSKNRRWLESFYANSEYILDVERKTHGIFPSGSRGRTDVEAGALRIAAAAGVPIVMVGIHGTKDDLKTLKKTGRRPKIAVAVSEPVHLGRRDKAGLQTLHDEQKQRAIELHNRCYAA